MSFYKILDLYDLVLFLHLSASNISGAKNIHMASLVDNETGTMKSQEEVKKRKTMFGNLTFFVISTCIHAQI